MSAYRQGLHGRVTLRLCDEEQAVVRREAREADSRLVPAALFACLLGFAIVEVFTLPLVWACGAVLLAALGLAIRMRARPPDSPIRASGLGVSAGVLAFEREGIRLEAEGVELFSRWGAISSVTDLGGLWVLHAGPRGYVIPERLLTQAQRTALARLLEDLRVEKSTRSKSGWPHALRTTSVACFSLALLDVLVRLIA